MKVGRNDPCTCGSGKKYKQCCLHKPLLARKKITAQKAKTTEEGEDSLMKKRFGSSVAEQFKPLPTEKQEHLPEHPFQL